ncbi:protein-ADP-ribose hydrolase [Clostridium estertheticum]|uniref:protein-ADP-ribose hydrolase n=1 Tax=Clostridium estertheticum TaxID=238834 RepID=UPI001C0C11D2|nr:protein-ADP-ribose hydrolase [Clostridium estertheticum]MBU3177665.1 protein-ADP-ribose hydrolase [Clostridium estertheticum]
MTNIEQLNFLIKELKNEANEYYGLEIPTVYNEKRKLLRALMNVRRPQPISEEFLKVQDEFLSSEASEKGITKLMNIMIEPTNNKMSIWQGDITTLEVDAIVNAANSQMLGCFQPCHKCIDNAIHSAAGIQLREECNDLMQKKEGLEPTGSAMITKAYNLPSKYVIHTIGPIIENKPSKSQEQQLKDCYFSCLKLAVQNNVKSIAFCCISTGVFNFPQKRAAEIAIETVVDFLSTNNNNLERIIYNVYTKKDFTIYKNILG